MNFLINCLLKLTRSRSRKIFEGSEPEPPKIGRLRNSAFIRNNPSFYLFCISEIKTFQINNKFHVLNYLKSIKKYLKKGGMRGSKFKNFLITSSLDYGLKYRQSRKKGEIRSSLPPLPPFKLLDSS